LSKERAKVDLWVRDIAPSNALRKWFAHQAAKWPEFEHRYFKELVGKKELVKLITEKAREGNVTLLYGAKDNKFNNAVALRDYMATWQNGQNGAKRGQIYFLTRSLKRENKSVPFSFSFFQEEPGCCSSGCYPYSFSKASALCIHLHGYHRFFGSP